MQTKEFEYLLPREFIAQDPVEPRDSSRLLILERKKQRVGEGVFRQVIDYLSPGDVLVLNDSQVMPARLPARKISGGKAELFLLKDLGKGRWQALVKPGATLLPGAEVIVGKDVTVKILERTTEGGRIVQFPSSRVGELALRRFGQVPLPPYIKKPVSNPARYQTVYAKNEGSLAAPTAALHWTVELLQRLEDKGVVIVYLTLHMGLGSFRPIREEVIEKHRLPAEYYEVSDLVAEKVNEAKKSRKQVVACGTDVVRTLETVTEEGALKPGQGTTSLFITPNYRFKMVDKLITNLHLPRSSHLVLVSAFAGRDFVFRAYQYALEKKFKFYTFGDATMVI